MAVTCEVIEGDLGSIYPVQTSRKEPTDVVPKQCNWAVIDCAGDGLTLTQSVWAIDTDDDDGSMTLGQETIDGLTARVQVSGGTDGQIYRIWNSVTASDGSKVSRALSVPVIATRKRNA